MQIRLPNETNSFTFRTTYRNMIIDPLNQSIFNVQNTMYIICTTLYLFNLFSLLNLFTTVTSGALWGVGVLGS